MAEKIFLLPPDPTASSSDTPSALPPPLGDVQNSLGLEELPTVLRQTYPYAHLNSNVFLLKHNIGAGGGILLFAPPRKEINFFLNVCLVTLIGLMPFITMFIFISGMHNVFIAMVMMHWVCMVTLPCIYTMYVEGSIGYYRSFWLWQSFRISKQVLPAVIAFLVGSCGVFSSYVVVKCKTWNQSFCVDIKQLSSKQGFDAPVGILVALGVYFVIFNPAIEEFFWRTFLYREIGELFVSYTYPASSSSNGQRLLREYLSSTRNVDTESVANTVATETTPLQSSDASCTYKDSIIYSSKETPDREGGGGDDVILEGVVVADSGGKAAITMEGRYASMAVGNENNTAINNEGKGNDNKDDDESSPASAHGKDKNSENEQIVCSPSRNTSPTISSSSPPPRSKLTTCGLPAATAYSIIVDETNANIDSYNNIAEDTNEKECMYHTTVHYNRYRYIQMRFMGRLFLSLLYTSYHTIVLFYLIGAGYAFIVSFFLITLGLTFIWMIQHPVCGLLVAMALHAGVDAGAVGAYADAYFKFF